MIEASKMLYTVAMLFIQLKGCGNTSGVRCCARTHGLMCCHITHHAVLQQFCKQWLYLDMHVGVMKHNTAKVC